MKKNLFRSGFNLIEVTMAIAVVGIGIAGVMALFPPAIEANKNANFQNYTGTMVDNIATYLGCELNRKVSGGSKYNWDNLVGEKVGEGWTDGSLPKAKANAPIPGQETNTDGWTEPSIIINGKTTVFRGVFTTGTDNVLGIKSYDGSIAAHARYWKDNSRLPSYYDKSEITTDQEFRVKIVIELSWPIAKPYADREKQEFVYEFNKPE